MPTTLTDIVLGIWPLLTAAAPVAFAGGIWYLRTQFATKQDFDALSQKVGSIATAVQAAQGSIEHLSDEQDSAPTRIQLMEKIAGLDARVSGMESGIDSVRHQLATTNDYLKILVDRGLK